MAGQARRLAIHHNQDLPLVDYLLPLIGDKKQVKIADIGSGPFSIIGNKLDGVDVSVYPSDGHGFESFWKNEGIVPKFHIAVENMEKLSYEDGFFDIVVCNNALDHTRDALAAVREMIRVTAPGGWVRIDCNLDQLDTGHRHFWNAKEDGMFISKNSSFDLKKLGFTVKFVDNGGARRYNNIIATFQRGL